MKFGLSEKNIAAITSCFRQNSKITHAILYGSRAKGTQRPGSDIDLTLKGEALTLQDLYQLEDLLDNLMLPYKFDLSIYNMIDSEDLKEHIQRVGISFYTKNDYPTGSVL